MVRNDRRTKLLPKIIIGQLFVSFIIVALALLMIFYTEGYRMDFSDFKVFKTGVIYLNFLPRNANISINSTDCKAVSNLAKNLPSGFYHISVAKDGYKTWNLSLQITPSSVNDYRDIILFKDQITPADLKDESKISLINLPTDVLASNAPDQLLYNNYEIWVGDNLVTRFSTAIKKAIWYPDLAHIVYQQGDEIRIIETTGQNDTLLVKLSTQKISSFVIGARGTELYYTDNGAFKIATIR